MGLAKHQKKKVRKSKKQKIQNKIAQETCARSYMTDAMLCRLSQKTCNIVLTADFLNNQQMESIRQLYARNILNPDQYLAVLEHAETWLEDTAETLFADNSRQKERYYKRAAFPF